MKHLNEKGEKIIMARTNPRTVHNSQLKPGSIILVRGHVGFSRISRQTTNEERIKDNQRRTHQIEKNYTTITIYNAQVMARNPQAPTPEEIYALESCYTSSSQDYPGNNFTGINKSAFLPKVGVLAQGGNPDNHPSYDEITLEGELQKGTDVTLLLRVFAGQGGNNGVSLDTILINQSDFQYYGNSAHVTEAMNAFGINFNAKSPAERAADQAMMQTPTAGAPANTAAMTQPQAQAPQADSNPFGAGAFGQTGMQSAQGMPAAQAQPGSTPFAFGTQPQQTPAEAQPGVGVQFGVGPGPERTY